MIHIHTDVDDVDIGQRAQRRMVNKYTSIKYNEAPVMCIAESSTWLHGWQANKYLMDALHTIPWVDLILSCS